MPRGQRTDLQRAATAKAMHEMGFQTGQIRDAIGLPEATVDDIVHGRHEGKANQGCELRRWGNLRRCRLTGLEAPLFNTQFIVGENKAILIGLRTALGPRLLGKKLAERN